MQGIQLQLESVDHQQRSLEARGVAVEKKIRGEEPGELSKTLILFNSKSTDLKVREQRSNLYLEWKMCF